MQAGAAVQPSPTSPSFAALLAALARDRKQPSSNRVDDVERDVVTLSYDRALWAHARYRPESSDRGNRNDSVARTDAAAAFQPESAAASPAPAEEAGEACIGASRVGASRATGQYSRAAGRISGRPAAQGIRPSLEEKRKRASVTVRMSKAEFAQLQQRADEAGLTVSAYLRSCTLEVEALRAQVKQALAELRAAKAEQTLVQPRASWMARALAWMRIGRLATA